MTQVGISGHNQFWEYDIDQDLLTTSSPTFAAITVGIDSGITFATLGDPFQIHTHSAIFAGTRDDVVALTYNVVPGTAITKINAAEPVLRVSFEANYNSGAANFCEMNWDYLDTTGLVDRRPIGILINRATNAITVGLAGQINIWDDTRTLLRFATSTTNLDFYGDTTAAFNNRARTAGATSLHYFYSAAVNRGQVGADGIGQFTVGSLIDQPVCVYQNSTPAIQIISGQLVGINKAAPTTRLAVVGLPSYANNAAALAAGKTAGDFYCETGTDPLRICAVY